MTRIAAVGAGGLTWVGIFNATASAAKINPWLGVTALVVMVALMAVLGLRSQ